MYKQLRRVVCLQAVLCFLGASLSAMPAQIVIVPSAEQSGGVLILTGQERAQALAPYLTQTQTLIIPGVFQSVFATKPNVANTSFACIQTLTPLGYLLSLPVHSPYGVGQEAQLAQLILNDQRYEGTNIMIAWQLADVPALIEALGYTSTIDPIPANRSDLTFVLPYPITTANPTVYLQELLFGDSTTLPP